MPWIGRRILGDELPIGVQCLNSSMVPTAPDAAPTYRVYSEAGGAAVTNGSLPPLEKTVATGLFRHMLPLGSLFAAGRYHVRYAYVISGTTYVPLEQDQFEIVAGGDDDGMVNSMFFMDRPDGNDWILSQTDQGTLSANRGPRV